MLILHDPQLLKNMNGRTLYDWLSNPQSLNGYSYSTNNPIIYIDPDGKIGEGFGRYMAGGQRQISSFLHQAADYTTSNGGAINWTAGFVTHAIADTAGNIANIFDPDQKPTTRLLGLGLTAIDASTGDEGKAIIKAGEKVFGLKVTSHAAEQFIARGMETEQVSQALLDGVKYLDKQTGNMLHVIGERGKGGFTIITDSSQKVLVSVEDFVRNLTPKSFPDRFQLLK
jgi:hypothetical protein